jgi:hypothetical protein
MPESRRFSCVTAQGTIHTFSLSLATAPTTKSSESALTPAALSELIHPITEPLVFTAFPPLHAQQQVL